MAILFLAALLILLPGGAAVVWLMPARADSGGGEAKRPARGWRSDGPGGGDWVERLIVAMGLSVVFYTLLAYATLTGLRLNGALIWGILAASGALIVSYLLLKRRDLCSISALPKRLWALIQDPLLVLMGVVFLLVLAMRIWVIRDLPAPRWGDAYQHAVITQLLIEHGGLFDSWAPYAPYESMTMHLGFHANAAVLAWVSERLIELDGTQSVLWTGQIFNALAAMALYPLGKRIAGRLGGILSVLIGGIATTVPMVYVNWGRYPQLTGQIILPISAWLLWRTLDQPRLDWRSLLLAGITVAGQALAYYRMPYYYALLIAALLLCVYLPRLGRQWSQWVKVLSRTAIVAVIAALILVPWGLHMRQGRLTDAFIEGIPNNQRLERVLAEYAQWKTITVYVALPFLLAAGAALVWAVIDRSGPAVMVGTWALGIALLVAGRLIGLPGASHLTSFATMIFMYAPVSLLIGWLGAQLVRTTMSYWNRKRAWAGVSIIVILAVAGAYKNLGISDPGYDLVKPADMEAMAWIRTNTAPDARFLVNGFLIYNGRSVVGSDAGWWIPLLTQRANTMPPQYALLNERETETGYGQRMVALVAGLEKTPLTTQEGLALLCAENITHVYIGQGEGQVGAPPPKPLFTAQDLLSTPAFKPVYHQDRVWIFALEGQVCAP